MQRFFAIGPARHEGPVPRTGTAALLVLILAGLLRDVAPHDEAYAGVDYALSLLALVGAAGCIASLAHRLARDPARLPQVGPNVPAPAAADLGNPPNRGEGWPLLVALLFGPLAVLLAGLGGWV